jgi:tRNA (guanine37-N1)-methyltransferase
MNLRDQLSGTIPAPLLHLTPKRFDIIGDVAVISIPPELDLKIRIFPMTNAYS